MAEGTFHRLLDKFSNIKSDICENIMEIIEAISPRIRENSNDPMAYRTKDGSCIYRVV
jgi:hypothetical protein